MLRVTRHPGLLRVTSRVLIPSVIGYSAPLTLRSILVWMTNEIIIRVFVHIVNYRLGVLIPRTGLVATVY